MKCPKESFNPNFATAKFAFRPPSAGLTPPEAAHSADFSIEKSGFKRLKLQKCLIALALSLAFATVKAGADMPTAQFLLVGQGARAEAMGQSVVANCFDETATYWNPAAMSFVSNPILGFTGTNLTDNVNSSYISFVCPYNKFGFGFRLVTMDSTIDNYDAITGNKLSQSLAENDSSMSILASYRLLDCLSVGLGLGNTNMKLSVPGQDYSAGTNNTSLGVLYKKNFLSLGVSLNNMGGTIKLDENALGESLPQTLNIGGALSLLEKKNLTVAVALENVMNDSNAGGIRLGGEYAFNKYFALRGGFMSVPNSDPEITFGFGINVSRFELDYADAIVPGGSSDSSESRVGLSFKFGVLGEEAKAAEPVESASAVKEVQPTPAQPAVITQNVSAATTIQVQTAPVTNIAVADLSGKNVSQADASIVADFLRTELVNTGKCSVVEKANMDKILAESSFQQTGCTSSECAVQIGKILNVKHMIVGSLSKLMDTYYITVNLVDVETSKIVASYDQSAMSAKELRTACKTLAQKLVNPQGN